MTDIEINSEDEIKKKFENSINQTGHSLEDKVEKILRKIAWSYRREAHYVDLDGKSDRQIDFIVSAPSVSIPPEIRHPVFVILDMIIECKNLPDHAWIFSGSERSSLQPEYTFTGIPNKHKKLLQMIPRLDGRHFTANSYSEHILPDKKRQNEILQDDEKLKSNKKTNNLYEAIVQVTKSSRYRQIYLNDKFTALRNTNKKIPDELRIFQSLVIFKGRMYKTNLMGEKITLELIKFARVEKEFLSANYHEINGEIHIVSYDWILDYFALLTSSYGLPPYNNVFENLFDMDRHREDFL